MENNTKLPIDEKILLTMPDKILEHTEHHVVLASIDINGFPLDTLGSGTVYYEKDGWRCMFVVSLEMYNHETFSEYMWNKIKELKGT